MRKLAGITCIIAVSAYMLSATRGITSLMMNITGLPEWASILIAWLSFTIFTIISGSPGVLVTDTMMFLVFLSAAIIRRGVPPWAATMTTTSPSGSG